MPQSSSWKVVWITGASSGIGAALAERLASSVEAVAISARSTDKLANIAEHHSALSSWPLDVTDAAATVRVVADIQAAHGPIDLAILNAAAWTPQPVKEFTVDAVRLGVEVNYMGVIHGLAAVLPGMLARGRGHIAIVASVAGYRGLPNSITYGPTKAALINLAETLRAELEREGITISVVNPGFVDTPATQKNDFAMPGLMAVEDAARAMEAGLRQGRYEISFPWGFTTVMKLVRNLPNWLFFQLTRRMLSKT